jgi:hypothetical protein
MWTHKAKKIAISINGDGSKIVVRRAATAITAAAQTCQEMNLNISAPFSAGHSGRLKDKSAINSSQLAQTSEIKTARGYVASERSKVLVVKWPLGNYCAPTAFFR